MDNFEGKGDASTIAAIASAVANGIQQELDGRAVLVPDGYSLEDLQGFDDTPRRTKETINAITLQGFLDYFNRYAGEETVIFADPVEGEVTAVFDYHQPGGEARWGDHQIAYSPAFHRLFKFWSQRDGDLMRHDEFGEMVEEHAEDFHTPPPARFLEIARHFEVQKNVEFKRTQRLESGDVQIRYQEESNETGNMEIPHEVFLAIPVFKGGDLFQVDARFRYRVKNGTLKLGLKLLNLDDVQETAAKDIVSTVEATADEQDVPVFYAY